ncbi:PIN-like domain-containing protein [Bacillus aerius]|uniref:PIN-like domain-containing protein n=1 Tax=Bacillus aerius TaxID=293388 RepID=UPI00344DFD1A
MREKFREFYFDKNDERIWKESIIVLDANVLLNLYRYTKETSDQILGLLKKYSDQLWIPHQVALEYHYNRKTVIMEQNGSYKKVCSAFNAIPNKVKDLLNQDLSSYKKRHKEDVEEFIKVIEKVTEDQIKKLNENVVEYDLNKDDVIKTKITELYYNKVGEPYNEEQMKKLEKEADKRLNMEIPPGYKDYNKKTGNKFYDGVVIQNKYGDLILWKQLLDFAKNENTSIIFLTDEQKEDWWYKMKSKIIGPKVELLNEFTSLTKKEFHMFTSLGFVERHENDLNPDTVSEVRKASEDYEISDVLVDLSEEQLISIKRILEESSDDNNSKYSDESIDIKISDPNALSTFYRWLRNNQDRFRLDNYSFSRFFNILENDFDTSFANKIMEFLYNENMVYLHKDRGMMIKMDLLKSQAYLALINN